MFNRLDDSRDVFVLFLCTGNSCRSQLAEALVNARMGERWEAVSAGTQPAGYVHPKALAALRAIADEQRAEPADLAALVI